MDVRSSDGMKTGNLGRIRSPLLRFFPGHGPPFYLFRL